MAAAVSAPGPPRRPYNPPPFPSSHISALMTPHPVTISVTWPVCCLHFRSHRRRVEKSHHIVTVLALLKRCGKVNKFVESMGQ